MTMLNVGITKDISLFNWQRVNQFEFQILQWSTEVSFLLVPTHNVVRRDSHIQVYN